MASTIATFDEFLKVTYTENRVENLTQAENPEIAMVKKDENFMGDAQKVTLMDRRPQGTSNNFQTAQGNKTNVDGAHFQVTVGDYFGVVEIGEKVIRASRGNPGAFLQNQKAEIDGLYGQMGDDMARAFWHGNGGIAIGKYASVSTLTITLQTLDDIVNFEINQVLVASSGTGSLTSDVLRAGTMTVQSVDRENGTFTVDQLIGGLTAGDSLFKQGNFAGNTGGQIIYGVGEFVYSSSSSVPNLYGMVRTTDPQRRAGCRVPTTEIAGLGIEERARILMTRMIARYKGPGPDKLWVHPEDFNALATELQGRGMQPMVDNDAKGGFSKLRVIGGGKTAEVFTSRWIQQGNLFALKWDTWTLASMGKLFAPQSGDGLTMLRSRDSASYEFRLLSYPALYCRAPGWNGRCSV